MADYDKPLVHGIDSSGNKVPFKVSANGGFSSGIPSTSVVTSNTSPVTGNFQAVQILVEATFSAWTETGLTGSMTGFAIPAGVIIFGNITGYTLSSGRVKAYGVS